MHGNRKSANRGPRRPYRGGGKPRKFRGSKGPRDSRRGPEVRRNVPPLISSATLQRGPKARFQALQMLCEADEKNRFIDAVLEQRATAGKLEPADRYLIQEICYGAIRHRNSIDYVLDSYIQFSMRRHALPLRWGLRLAAYQLVYLSRIPSHAAIHGTLEAMKAIGGLEKRDIGFANAVLRRVHNDIRLKSEDPVENDSDRMALPARHGWCHFKRPVLPSPNPQRAMYLAIKYSHPKWLMSRWLERYGEVETVPLCLENNRVPLVSAIITTDAATREEIIEELEEAGVTVEPGAIDDAIRLRRPGDIRDLEVFRRRWVRIQDETAKQIGEALDPPRGASVLDLCAAPGGKAAQLLESIGPEGHLTACDLDDAKLARLEESLRRVGDNFTLVKLPRNPRDINLRQRFSHILVDAPCSNTGVLARRPEARWRIHYEDLPKLAKLQSELLAAAAAMLDPGGRMVYATCSIEPEENGQVVSSFLRRHPEFEELESRLFLPHRDGADGGYYSVLQTH